MKTDEIVSVVPKEFVDLALERVCYHMENAIARRGVHLTIPLEAVGDKGKSYYEAK